MSPKTYLILVGIAVLMIAPFAASGQTIGGDAVVGDLWGSIEYYGSSFGISGYAAANTICNFGTVELDWYQPDNRHPIEGTQLYRLMNGRFEQLGLSWAKHNYAATAADFCELGCIPPDPYTGETLGVGCSNSTSAIVNGSTGRLGPRGQINAFSGVFPYHYSQVPYPPRILEAIIGRKLQVRDDDLDPSLNSGARYFLEVQVIAADDAAGDNALNNATYREVLVSSPSDGVYHLTFTGDVVMSYPAIYAWAAADPSVQLTTVDVPNEGRFIVGAKVTSLAYGVYEYEYAVYNLNSHRCARSFAIPVEEGVTTFDAGFHDVRYHGGDGDPNYPGSFRGDDWTVSTGPTDVIWETELYNSSDPQGNAIRWGTLYNFRTRATSPPTTGNVEIGLYRPGSPSFVTAATLVPGPPEQYTEIPTIGEWGLLILALLLMIAATAVFRPARICAQYRRAS